MGKHSAKLLDLPSSGHIPALVLLSVFFLLGAVAGCLLADGVGGAGGDALAAYLECYLDMVRSGISARPQLLSAAWDILRWPLFTVLLSLTALGVLGLPVLFAARGFLLSFAVASFFRVFGGMGLILAFVIFGITGLISIPVLFVLGVQGFLSSGLLANRLLGDGARSARLGRAYLSRCCLCAAALCVCLCVEYFAVPSLLETVAELFTQV